MKRNELKEAKKKIEMLANHLLEAIDVDLLSDSQRIAYLKAITPYILPKLESIKQETNLNVSDSLQWLIEEDEADIEAQINKKYGIGVFNKNSGLA
jgi:hypothetical protein